MSPNTTLENVIREFATLESRRKSARIGECRLLRYGGNDDVGEPGVPVDPSVTTCVRSHGRNGADNVPSMSSTGERTGVPLGRVVAPHRNGARLIVPSGYIANTATTVSSAGSR